MDTIEAILSRRTVREYVPDSVTKEQMEQILEAAAWAPNHKLTNPWEFYVCTGEAKEKLARLRGELKRNKALDPTSDKAQKAYDHAYQEAVRASYIVLVCQRLADDEHRREEDLLAVACAIENMLLAARAMGIGTFWSTGASMTHPETLRILGVAEGHRPVGLILLGEPAGAVVVPPRQPAALHTRWVE